MLRTACFILLVVCATFQTPHALAQSEILIDAARNLDLAGAKDAIARGADVNAVVGNPKTIQTTPLGSLTQPLAMAHGKNDPSVKDKVVGFATLLFANGAKYNKKYDRSLFAWAISDGHLKLVRLLVDNGAPLNQRIGRLQGGWTPTELAIQSGQADVYKFLVSHSAEPVSEDDATQIRFVRAAGSLDIHTFLEVRKKGGSTNRPDPSGLTPLLSALEFPIVLPDQEEIIRTLIDDGADVNRSVTPTDSRLDMIPLQEFVSSNSGSMNEGKPDDMARAERVMMMLMRAGAKVSSKDVLEATPLHAAASSDNLRAAEILIDEGAKVMARDVDGKTPLDYAESGAMIKLLKAHGAVEQ